MATQKALGATCLPLYQVHCQICQNLALRRLSGRHQLHCQVTRHILPVCYGFNPKEGSLQKPTWRVVWELARQNWRICMETTGRLLLLAECFTTQTLIPHHTLPLFLLFPALSIYRHMHILIVFIFSCLCV